MTAPFSIGGISPRLDLALEFWRALAGHEEAPICVQFFQDAETLREARKLTKEPDPCATFRHGTLRSLWPSIEQMQAIGAGVFYVVNQTDLRGRAKKNIVGVRAAVCDHDNDPPKSVAFDPARVNPGAPPSILVSSSPGNTQSLWLLREGEPIHEWTDLLKDHLIPWFHSDPPVNDLPRVLRLPGTLHLKRAPHLVVANYCDLNRRFSIEDLRIAYPRTKVAPKPKALPQTTAPVENADPTDVQTFGPKIAAALASLGANWPEQGRHSAQLALAGGLCIDMPDKAYEGLCAVCRIAGDEDPSKRETTINHTRAALDEGRSVAGWSVLATMIDPKIVRAAYEAITGTDELIAALSAPTAAQTLGAVVTPGWGTALLCDTKGQPYGCTSNVMIVLKNHPTWTDVLSYNTRNLKVILARAPWGEDIDPGEPYPRALEDADVTRTSTWLGIVQRIRAESATVFESMIAVAQQNKFDPAVDCLDALDPWDKVCRLGTWFRDFLGVKGDLKTQIYASIVGTRWMVQNVARIYDPGCQADIVPIFEGPQGLWKSSMLRALAMLPELFSDQLPSIDNKDAKAHVHGPAIIEVPELAAMTRSKIEAQKAFLTMREDKFRPPYGRVEIEVPRGCSFAGTVNPDGLGYLKDHTGNRRFLPIACTKIDLEGFRGVVAQLWAEAIHLYRNPDRPEVSWITREEMAIYAEHQQNARVEVDHLEEKIAEALTSGARADGLLTGWAIAPGTREIAVSAIMEHVCKDDGDLAPSVQGRVVRALRRLGWVQDPTTKRYRLP